MATLQMNILSTTLGMQTNFSVFLPSYVPAKENACVADYNTLYPQGVKFKTLWLLGTEFGDDQELLTNTAIARYAQKHNLAVVMPCTNNKLYSEDPKGQKFLHHITEELWTISHGSLALSEKREDNFIGGVSIGAYAALKAALRNPGKYSKVLMFGGAFEENIAGTYFADLNKAIAETGSSIHVGLDDALPDDAEVVSLAKELIAFRNPQPEISISWRENDEFAPYAQRAAENLDKLGFNLRQNVYGPQYDDLWDFCDLALRTELDEFICKE